MIKKYNDKFSNYLDTKGLANPVEVVNQELGGETREESKSRREKEKSVPVNPRSVFEESVGEVKKMAKGGTVKSASARADGCCIKGKTRA